MKSMKNIDYNQIDENGISVLEKIINSENTKALELVKNFEFEYLRELDYAYENIQNDTFKRKVKNLNVKFPHTNVLFRSLLQAHCLCNPVHACILCSPFQFQKVLKTPLKHSPSCLYKHF